ncbi:GntP family transporter [Nocardiopsis halotolerans]|uniref:GntP family transporter n=1 Tax=Nocardiopsis halotolerans TaxID=124252 RepID=UPI00034BCADA|nr:GntP family transporter [Nocardiopsis halotolerans]
MSVLVLVIIAAAAIAALLALVMWAKVPAFVALLLVAVVTAAVSGMPLEEIIPTVIEGMGGTLGSVALLVGLGAMLGAIVERTGGAEVLATRFVRRLGRKRAGPALLLASALIAIPIFFDVGFIVLVPIMFSFAKAAGHRSPVFVGVPIAGFMVYIHNTVPPHPGVTGSSTLLGADVGLVTLVGILLLIPLGPLAYYTSKMITSRREFPIDPIVRERFDRTIGQESDGGSGGVTAGPETDGGSHDGGSHEGGAVKTAVATRRVTKPGPGAVATMILLPILMILVGTVGGLVLDPGTTAGRVTSLVGQPAFALLVAVVLAMYVLGARNGWGRQEVGEIMDASLAPAAIVVFVTGAGGVFASVLTETGIGETISELLVGTGLPVLFLAFLLATVFKVAQGSGTVATLAAAGLVQSTVTGGAFSDLQTVLVVLAIGCGSVALSHINDSGFWIATRFLGLSVADGLRTWTVLATVLGWTGMLIITALWFLVG